MTKLFQHKTNGKTYTATTMASGILLENTESDERKTITPSTLHRYYKELEQVQEVQEVKQVKQTKQAKQTKQPKVTKKYDWRKYYKSYQKNTLPLWDAAITTDCKLVARDNDKNVIMTCAFTKTVNCIVITQQNGSKRYFTKESSALKHVLTNQDIRTTESITKVFKKWLGLFNKTL